MSDPQKARRVVLSPEAHDAASPRDVDGEAEVLRLRELARRIAAGEYRVSSEDLAERLMRRMQRP